MISSELARKLAKVENIGFNTASQRVSRAEGIERVQGFFKSNQSLIFLPNQQQGREVLKLLAQQMELHGKKYWFTLNALKYHAGTVSTDFLQTYSYYPVEPVSSHFTFAEVIQKFVLEGILVYAPGTYSFAPRLRYNSMNAFLGQTLETIKLNVLDNFKELARNIGWVSYESFKQFATYGNFNWAFMGVSPVRGLKTGKEFGFVIGDILLGRPTYKKDVEFFVRKIETVQSYKGASRVMPVLLVDSLDKEAFQYLKEKGVIIGVIKELFGEKYAKTLNDLITILTNAAASLAKNPNQYLQLINELRKYNDGLLKNIKGALFEYVAGHYYIYKHASLDMGWEIVENGAAHEMDVRATFGDKVIIAECKGRISPTPIEDINKFVRIKIPAFRSWLEKNDTHRNKSIEFEYWSSAGYTEDALLRIEELRAEYKRNIVTFLGPLEIMARAKEMKNKKLQKELDTFFFKSNV
ncbi:hypothetical protein GCM10023313_08040 [Mucilaginibacter defluvii]|uniref:Nuclease of restriction endonuclease-like (RecB) superfamily n=2 Tax=Mucilaginibacter defluvii TaxID=1196019 RepID=A0ABP9FMD0_9SPHI